MPLGCAHESLVLSRGGLSFTSTPRRPVACPCRFRVQALHYLTNRSHCWPFSITTTGNPLRNVTVGKSFAMQSQHLADLEWPELGCHRGEVAWKIKTTLRAT